MWIVNRTFVVVDPVKVVKIQLITTLRKQVRAFVQLLLTL